ncbi:MAG: DsbA family oxidoreductase [Cyanobacteria bacterium J06623_4]
MSLTISITSDFICPWCLVLDARLSQAIEQLGTDIEIQRQWYPLELNPDMPESGMDRKAYRSGKFGSWAYSQQLDAQTVQATAADKVEFRYDLMTLTPNTLKAHRLTWLASRSGKATEMAERILRAYFSEGWNISDVSTLAELAAEVGIAQPKEIEAFLLSDVGTQEIRALEKEAGLQGIRSVPTIQIGHKMVSGAQPVEALVSMLQSAVEEMKVASSE